MDSEGKSDVCKETSVNDQAFAWPSSSDRSLGTVEFVELGEDTVTFAAFEKPDSEFVRWIGPGGKIVASAEITLGLEESGLWTAVFEPKGES